MNLIETPRFVIRQFRDSDAEEAFQYLSNPVVMEHIESPFDLPQTRQFIRDAGGGHEPLVFAVLDRVDQKLIGHVIFHPWGGDRTIWEIGWLLRRDVWGQGVATELTTALIDYGFKTLRIDTLIGECDPANQASIKVMEKAGMHRSAELDDGLPTWSITRSDRKI